MDSLVLAVTERVLALMDEQTVGALAKAMAAIEKNPAWRDAFAISERLVRVRSAGICPRCCTASYKFPEVEYLNTWWDWVPESVLIDQHF